jgi:hypothetical protein
MQDRSLEGLALDTVLSGPVPFADPQSVNA